MSNVLNDDIVDPQQHEKNYPGPTCENIGLTIRRLLGLEYFPLPKSFTTNLTNAVILELRNFLVQRKLPWKHAIFWLKNIIYFEGLLLERDICRSWNSLQEKKIKLSKSCNKKGLAELLHSIYTLPKIHSPNTAPVVKLVVKQSKGCYDELDVIKEHNVSLLTINAQLRSDCNYLKSGNRKMKNNLKKVTAQSIKYKNELHQFKENEMKWNKRNFEKRETRRNRRIKYLREINKAMTKQVISLMKKSSRTLEETSKLKCAKIVKLRGLHVAKHRQMKCFAERCSALETALIEEKLKSQQHILKERAATEDIQRMEARLEECAEMRVLSFFHDGTFDNVLRQVIMCLGSKGIATEHMSSVIHTVLLKLGGITVPKLPSESCCGRIIFEGGSISKMQVMEAARKFDSNTVAVDGTTDKQRHYLNHQLATNDDVFTVSLCETASSDATTQLNTTLQIFKDYCQYLCKTANDGESVYTELVLSIKNIMSDQHIVNKCYKEKFETVRLGLLEKSITNWESIPADDKTKMATVHQWFCHLHVLIGLADTCDTALRTYENIVSSNGDVKLGRDNLPEFRFWKVDSSAGSRLIRNMCKMVGPDASAVAGVPEDFLQWLATRNKTNHLQQFSHTRFNILFKNAAALYYHLEDILEFLPMCKSTLLSKAVRADISEDVLQGEVRALGLFYKYVTEPFEKLLSSEKNNHILDLNPYFLELSRFLNCCHHDPRHMLTNVMWIDFPPSQDAVLKALEDGSSNDEVHMFTLEALSILSTHALVTTQHLLKCQLPGGVHGRDDDVLRAESTSVPLSNIRCEQAFGTLKQLQRYKPNASTEHLEACIMWSHNKTMNWLESLPEEERNNNMSLARNKTPQFLEKLRERRIDIRKQRLEKLKRKTEEEEEASRKSAQKRQGVINTVESRGGQCKSQEDIEKMLNMCETKTAKLSALKAQINMHKNIIKLPGIQKELYQFSKNLKQFSVEKLASNLNEIIQHHQTQAEATNSSKCIAPQKRRADELGKAKKMTMAKSALGAGPFLKKVRLAEIPSFSKQRIRHRWKVGKGHRFYIGQVLGPSQSTSVPSFPVDDEEDDEMTYGPLYDVIYDEEDGVIYHIRLNKDWLAGDVELQDAQKD